MRNLTKRMVPMLLGLICAAGLLPAQAFAAGAIDPDRGVSLTIEYKDDGAAVADVPFDLYYVADVDAYARFTLAGDFQKYPVKVNDLDSAAWKALAETLVAYADRDGLEPLDTGKTDGEGSLRFPSRQPRLSAGLYLVVGRQLVVDGYTYDTEPFLISLPNLDAEGDRWSYDVVATPKYEKTPPTPAETVERKVLKVWKDDVLESRPQSIAVQLLRDGAIFDTVTLSEANNWQYAWGELPKYNEDGSEIVWRLTEEEPGDYTVLVEKEGITFVVTNTYSPEKPDGGLVTRTVQKVWSDKGYENKRPAQIAVSLLENGRVYDTQTLTAANNWSHTWKDLPERDADGNEISWTIQESGVSGYTASVTQNGNTFVLTNSYNNPKLPQTGLLWWPVPLLAAGGVLFIALGIAAKKRKNRD